MDKVFRVNFNTVKSLTSLHVGFNLYLLGYSENHTGYEQLSTMLYT